MQGQTFFVTGASSGMGADSAGLMGSRGANVVLAALRESVCADVSRAVAQAVEHFGRLDGAFTYAGLLGTASRCMRCRRRPSRPCGAPT